MISCVRGSAGSGSKSGLGHGRHVSLTVRLQRTQLPTLGRSRRFGRFHRTRRDKFILTTSRVLDADVSGPSRASRSRGSSKTPPGHGAHLQKKCLVAVHCILRTRRLTADVHRRRPDGSGIGSPRSPRMGHPISNRWSRRFGKTENWLALPRISLSLSLSVSLAPCMRTYFTPKTGYAALLRAHVDASPAAAN